MIVRKYDLLYGFLSICWSLLCGLSIHDTFLVNVCAWKDWMCFLYLLDAVFSIYPLGWVYELCRLHLLYSNFCLLELSVTERCVKIKISHYDHDCWLVIFFFIYFRTISLRYSGLLHLPGELLLLCNNPLYSRHTFWLKIYFVYL